MYNVNASTIAAGLSNPSISIEAVVLTSHLPFFLYCASVSTNLPLILLSTGTALHLLQRRPVVFVEVQILRRGNHAQRRARSRATSASHIDGDRFTYAFIRFTASSSSVSRAFAFARASRSPNLLQAIESSFECFQSSPSRLILRRAAHPTPSNHEVTHHVPFASNRVARVGRNAPSATRVRAEKVAAVALRIEKRSRASSSSRY